ncbi:hypothetical protein QA600_19655 [Natronococcus sp. A-GB1]|uniref:hypothetical protein n=1 Tax=Natronococcus sp. A-GB1 TaxID=3037648 RepID=UPI00241D0C9A|nr:hypothetical protein [Natronococcus sp. A-GB1]MDG5761550.1 hypothetical protein [Natronococcus sp. A-GB1]
MKLIKRLVVKFQSDGIKKVIEDTAKLIRKIYIKPAKNNIIHHLLYGKAKPDPLALIHIKPTDVNYILANHFWHDLSKYTTHVVSGEWDQPLRDINLTVSLRTTGTSQRGIVKIDQLTLCQSIEERVQNNTPWEETELYAEVASDPEQFGGWKRYNSIDNLEKTLADIDNLISHMDSYGYKRQDEIKENSTGLRYSDLRLHEVAINIGRNGKIIFEDGRHRFCVARALGVEQIPVRVFVRHKDWQQKRQQMLTFGSIKEVDNELKKYLVHPDMQDVRPNNP